MSNIKQSAIELISSIMPHCNSGAFKHMHDQTTLYSAKAIFEIVKGGYGKEMWEAVRSLEINDFKNKEI